MEVFKPNLAIGQEQPLKGPIKKVITDHDEYFFDRDRRLTLKKNKHTGGTEEYRYRGANPLPSTVVQTVGDTAKPITFNYRWDGSGNNLEGRRVKKIRDGWEISEPKLGLIMEFDEEGFIVRQTPTNEWGTTVNYFYSGSGSGRMDEYSVQRIDGSRESETFYIRNYDGELEFVSNNGRSTSYSNYVTDEYGNWTSRDCEGANCGAGVEKIIEYY